MMYYEMLVLVVRHVQLGLLSAVKIQISLSYTVESNWKKNRLLENRLYHSVKEPKTPIEMNFEPQLFDS